MNKLKELRKNKKLTQEAFCKIIGVTQGALSGWENGRYEPDLKSVHKMADYFGVTVDYLLGREVVKNNKSKQASDEYESQLSVRDKKDVAKRLDEVIGDMERNEALMFDGEPMDDETKELVKIAIEESIKMAKVMAKKDTKKTKN